METRECVYICSAVRACVVVHQVSYLVCVCKVVFFRNVYYNVCINAIGVVVCVDCHHV